jgi:hypothetical protein
MCFKLFYTMHINAKQKNFNTMFIYKLFFITFTDHKRILKFSCKFHFIILFWS